MAFDMAEAKRLVRLSVNRAKRKMVVAKSMTMTDSYSVAEPLSDVVPTYQAREMDFGDYETDNFTVMFIDIRQSTRRAHVIGAEKTFLSLHGFFPGVAYTIEEYGGYVMDFMGDGVMAFFGGKRSGMVKSYAAQRAGLCGLRLLEVVSEAINPVLRDEGIEWKLSCGVGIDHGNVVVTKIGTNHSYDVKAFGDCVNYANKHADGTDKVVVSRHVKDLWPEGKGGKMVFTKRISSDGYELTRDA